MPPKPDSLELSIERLLDAPRGKVWRCWTEPDLLKRWLCPKPWFVSEARIDLRPGGEFYSLMNGPNGEQHDNPGVFLEVAPGECLVFTDAFASAWKPSGKAFMVAAVTFADAGDGKTHYAATARHWSEEDRTAHEQMGFHVGWNAAADQLEALARTL